MGMSYSYYILLYTSIYDFCTYTARAQQVGRTSGAALQGADLYRSLHSYLSEHCKSMREVCRFTL
jgi:cullin 1